MSKMLIFYLVYFIIRAFVEAYKAEQKTQRAANRQNAQNAQDSKSILKTYEGIMKEDMDFVKIFLQKVSQKKN